MIEIILIGAVIGALAAGLTHVGVFRGSTVRDELNGHLRTAALLAFVSGYLWFSLPSRQDGCGLPGFIHFACFLLGVGATAGYLMVGLGFYGLRKPESPASDSPS